MWITLATVVVGAASAQEFPGFGGVEARLGLASPDESSTGLSVAAGAELGYIGIPFLRVIAGVDHFRSNVNRRPFAEQLVSGSLSGTGGRIGLRLDLLGSAVVSPSVFAALTAHDVSVDAALATDRNLLDREFGGFQVGGSFGAGGAYSLDQERRFRAIVEVRRVLMPNVSHWAGEVGIRLVPRGRQAHTPVPRLPW